MNKRNVVAKVTRDIAANPREVFKAWTNPKHPASPWSKRNGIRLAIVNPTVNGLFYINMGPPMPLATHFGRFLRLDMPKLIEHTWASEGTLGAETRVRITLKPKVEQTLFSLRHTGLPDVESARGHEEGWGWIVGWLADGFAAKKR
ncbi:MAG: SRPBCC domain-containing protein [Thermoplasmata archaeon]